MSEQQPSRWRPTRRQLLWAGCVAALAFLIIVLCGYLFGWKWTGLPKRTLWDWLDLLIVPAVLAVGGYLLTERQRALDRELSTRQAETDRELADERRQDNTLQAYLDGMSQLLTDKEQPLHSAQSGDNLSTVARARTLTVLGRLDSGRKKSVLRFLYESGLINKEHTLLNESDLIEWRHNIVSLQQADLRGADLLEANLRGADLRGVILENADLRGANLRGTDLSKAYLSMARLRAADLSGANLRGAILRAADLRGAILSRADLSRAILEETDLRGADLSEAILARADLRVAMLEEADLSGAMLEETDLRGADLSGAMLKETDLRGLDLRREADLFWKWTEEQFSAAIYLEGATMPNGQKFEDWLKSKDREQDGKNDGSS